MQSKNIVKVLGKTMDRDQLSLLQIGLMDPFELFFEWIGKINAEIQGAKNEKIYSYCSN